MINLKMLMASGANISNFEYVEFARQGIEKDFLDDLADVLSMKISNLSKVLPLSTRTLQRYETKTLLPKEISDRTIQIARVMIKAIDIFDDKDMAVSWLKTPNRAFGDLIPIDLLDTYSGIELVFDELIKIEHGTFA